MKHQSKLLLATILAGSIGLAGLGISRAQTADTVDTAVTATTTTSTGTTAPMPMFGRGGHHAERLTEQAEKFGMTVAELQTAIESGKPMYQIAAEHGYTYAKAQADRLAEFKTRLDDMVKVKYMTQAEADAIYANAKDNPMMGAGFGGPGRHR